MKNNTKRHITIYDIARELGMSASTVSRALHDHPGISQETKDSVNSYAKEHGYQPNVNARSLKTGRGNAIGVVVPLINRNFFASAIDGIEEVAFKAGYGVVISQSKEEEARERKIMDVFSNGKVDGVIISVASGTETFDHIDEFARKGLPVVLFDRIVNIPNTGKVSIDDFQGSYNAVVTLLEQGCRKIFHLSGPLNVKIWADRYQGYLAALKAYKVEFNPDWLFVNSKSKESGEEAVRKMIAKNNLPDAIFSASDFSALGAMLELKRSGINVPNEVAIIGFANEPFSEFVDPSLSSVNQYSTEMGRIAANLLIEQINGHPSKQVILQPELIIRDSSLKKL